MGYWEAKEKKKNFNFSSTFAPSFCLRGSLLSFFFLPERIEEISFAAVIIIAVTITTTITITIITLLLHYYYPISRFIPNIYLIVIGVY